MTYALAVYRQDICLTNGELIYVHANPHTRTAQPLPDVVRNALCRFDPSLATAPQL